MLFDVVLWGSFGLIVGSFANVLILRFDRASVMGRSVCPHCGRALTWYELVPVISWLVLRGRCRTCGAWISLQYPLVELIMGGLFVVIGLAPAALAVRMIGCTITLLLVAIAVYDLRHTIMPDPWVYSFGALAFVSSVLTHAIDGGVTMPSDALELLFAGPVVALPLWFLWRISEGRWMGFGDVKFALGIGWLLGPWYGFLALMYAFIIGALVGVFILLPLTYVVDTASYLGITRFRPGTAGFTMKSEVPFGPFLIVSTFVVWFSVLYVYEPILSFPEALVFWNFSW